MDLQAGSEFGYRLLFVVLLAGVFAVFLQVRDQVSTCLLLKNTDSNCIDPISYQSLASKLGVVTGLGEPPSHLISARVELT